MRKQFARSARISIVLGSLFFAAELSAKPEGFRAVAGDAKLSEASGALVIESGKKAIIHWDHFSLSKDEIARFIQHDSKSAVLNRVVGGKESSILGLLESNGQVYLINPQGVFIGPGARIETAGFVASTFDVLDDDFLQGNALLFKGDSSRPIQNLGTIFCPSGNIHLFAAQIVNDGQLLAPQGHILLQMEGAADIYVRPVFSEEPVEGASIEHRGSIAALTVELQAGASPYAKAIQCSGLIEAMSVEEVGGDIRLVAEKGITEVDGGRLIAVNTNGQGGTIHLLGEKVGLQGDTKLDVSGASGGGTILIGGDFQGKNPDIKNSTLTFISKETEIKADALYSGSGGRVIVWSDEATHAYGHITARGGELGGDGGFVEVSGKHLDFQGLADRRAPHGNSGTLLLDPLNLVIGAMADSGTITNPGGAGTYGITGCGTTPAQILADGVADNLQLGNVTISTSAPPSGAGCADIGTIIVSAPIGTVMHPWSTTNTLTITANATLTISSAITNTNASNTVFDAMNFTALNPTGPSQPAGSGLIVGAAISCTGAMNKGNITLSGNGGTGGTNGGVDVIAAGSVSTTAGNITFSNSTGGPGAAGNNRGVNIASTVSSTSGSIFFSNCMGGVGGTSVGVRIAGGVTATSGTVTFMNCTGGTGSTSAGVRVAAGGSISAPTIDATVGITGGNNANPNNYGFHVVGGTVGSASTISLSITATGGGTVASEQGIRVDSGTIQIGSTGTMTLIGMGSTTGGNSCSGIDIEAAGIVTGGDAAQLFLTGTGGGTGAVNNGFGIVLGGALSAGTMALTSTANITLNGMGGPGTGGTNRGVISQPTGSITLIGIGTIAISGTGGTGTGAGNGGVDLNSPVTAVMAAWFFQIA